MTDPSTPVPSDEAVSDAWCELHDGLPSGCSQVLARKALIAAYAIDAPRLRAEAAAEGRAAMHRAIVNWARAEAEQYASDSDMRPMWTLFADAVEAARPEDKREAGIRAAMRDEIVEWLRGNWNDLCADAIEAAFPTTGGSR